ncbi:MAG: hypothetical protein ACTS73_01325 [Arsenophonus sp. NEOnobi-MAG3]
MVPELVVAIKIDLGDKNEPCNYQAFVLKLQLMLPGDQLTVYPSIIGSFIAKTVARFCIDF